MLTQPRNRISSPPEAPPLSPTPSDQSEEPEEAFDPLDPLSWSTYERLNRVAECELYRENLLPVKIAGKPFSVILDTGADRTVISEEFYETLCKLTPLNSPPAYVQKIEFVFFLGTILAIGPKVT